MVYKNTILSTHQVRELEELGFNIPRYVACLWLPIMEWDNINNKSFVKNHYLSFNNISSEHYWNTNEGKNTLPTLTLYEILEMIPNTIEIAGDVYNFEMFPNGFHKAMGYVTYHQTLVKFDDTDMLQNAFNMLKWVIKNRYLKNTL